MKKAMPLKIFSSVLIALILLAYMPDILSRVSAESFATKPMIAAGANHTVAIKSDGTLWAWGDNDFGQLGDGTTNSRYTPVQVKNLTGVVDVAAGDWHTVALKSDGTVWVWGNNKYGQLGDGTSNYTSPTVRSTPIQVKVLTGVVAVEADSEHSVALKSDGTVWAWGNNSFGILGDGTTTDQLIPVQVKGLTGVVAISTAPTHVIALKSDGTICTWGFNGDGQIGDGTTTNRLTPVQIQNLTGVVDVAAGLSYTVALKSDGTVWTWGCNTLGQLGDGTKTNHATPVQVSGLTGVASVAAGSNTVALKSDGTVWVWGSNSNGQLGDGTSTNRLTPERVSDLTGVVDVTAYHNNCALKSDGAVWAWGYNYSGNLGDGTTTHRNTPVQVKGENGVGYLNLGASTAKVSKPTVSSTLFVNTYTNCPGFQVEIGEKIRILLEIKDNDKTILGKDGFSSVIDNKQILSSSSSEVKDNKYIFEFQGVSEGTASIKFVEPELKLNVDVKIQVISAFPYYRCNKIPSKFGFASMEIENYSCRENDDGTHNIKMDVYNVETGYSYGAISVYNSNGDFIEARAIDPFSTSSGMEMVVDSVRYIWADITNWGTSDYKKDKHSQYTPVEIDNIPNNSYFTLTSDSKASDIVAMYNGIDIFTKCVFTATSLDLGKDAQQKTVKELMKKILNELPKSAVESIGKDLIKAMEDGAVTDKVQNICNVFSNAFSKNGINFNDLLKNVLKGLGYTVADKTVEALIPEWAVVSTISDFREIGDMLVLGILMSLDEGEVKVYFNSHNSTNFLVSNVVTVKTADNGNFGDNTILDAYSIEETSSDKAPDSALKDWGKDYYQYYNVTLRDNGVEIQPSGSIEIRMPIPEGYNSSLCNVYRIDKDGNKTKMTSRIDGNYLVFTTDHLCYFLVTDKAQNDPTMLIIIIASCGIAVSILIAAIIFVKKKKRKPLQ